MTSDVLRFEFGTLTEFVAPNGKRFLRGTVDGLTLTAIPEPDREPAAGGVMRWSLWASPTPSKARNVRGPVPAQAPAVSKPATKAQREERAVDDIRLRYGAIPARGDDVPDLGDPLSGDDPFALDRPLCEIEDEA